MRGPDGVVERGVLPDHHGLELLGAQLMDRLVEQLVLHEGKRSRAYMDSVGKITVGVGRNLSDKGLSEDEITYLLHNDIDECVADLAMFAFFGSLDPIRQRVLVDMRFNLGPTRFRGFRAMLAAVTNQDYPRAAKCMRESLWFRQVRSRGERLAQMMRTGEDYH